LRHLQHFAVLVGVQTLALGMAIVEQTMFAVVIRDGLLVIAPLENALTGIINYLSNV